jgi:hypothetical protein
MARSDVGHPAKDTAVPGCGLVRKSGFLHCAAHGETVSSFGRNDGFFGWEKKAKTTATATALWLVDGLHPTLREEAAKDGAPERLWLSGRKQGQRQPQQQLQPTRVRGGERSWYQLVRLLKKSLKVP